MAVWTTGKGRFDAGGETICSRACANTMTDRTNCGTCGNACGAGETCMAGACASDCTAPRARCLVDTVDVCLDTSSDNAHCGSCTNVCPSGQTCAGGTCGCGAARTACGASCVDAETDRSNCGSCGRACAASETCRDGGCRCEAGLTECAAGCVNTRTSNANCGTCGTVCMTGQSCSNGSCSSVCAAMPGTIFCEAAGACVNPSTSAAHCGGCGMACGAGTVCGGGTCRPANDLRANALPIALGAAEVTVTGSTVNALRDGAGSTCGCTSTGVDVWHSFTLTSTDVVYFDTIAAATGFDTALYLANASGATITGTCQDDSDCTGRALQSQVAARLAPGSYYVVVTGCGTGAFTLHGQKIAKAVSSFTSAVPIADSAFRDDILGTTSAHMGMCGGNPSGEDLLWFITCGASQFASLCPSDGGSWTRFRGDPLDNITYDPMLSLYSASTGTDIACNDDGLRDPGGPSVGCYATDDMSSTYGPRLRAAAPRGLNAFIVDERFQASGLRYRVAYTITR